MCSPHLALIFVHSEDTIILYVCLKFDRILDDMKQSCDEALSGGAPGRTILIRGEGVRNCRSSERINFSASPGRFFGYFLVDTRK